MRTQGSETSQYLEEKKANKGTFFLIDTSYRKVTAIVIRKKVLAIPLVAASETGIAQTVRVYMYGVVGQSLHLVAESYKM
jgi:hypothetical protein